MIEHLAGQSDEPSARLKSDSDSQAIYQSLRSSIVEGQLRTGARLPTERALASRFGWDAVAMRYIELLRSAMC